MDRKNLLALALCLPALSGAPTSASAEVPDDCSNGSLVSVREVSGTFSQRSVEIIKLAQHGDVSGLTPLVAPSARFTVWEGDMGIGRKGGPAGAVEFAQRISAAAYSYATVFAGPLSTDICGTQQVTIWLTRTDGQRAYIADFKYRKGVLIEAEAKMADVSEGKI